MRTVIRDVLRPDADDGAQPMWVSFTDDTIEVTGTGEAPEADRIVDGLGRVVVPGFIDLHSHGAGGQSFDEDIEELRGALETHRHHGTTRSVISLVTASVETLVDQLATIAELCASDPLVLGSHLEGPFLSAERAGAHDPSLLRAPDSDTVTRLLEAAAGTLRQITIAPELPGAMDAVDRFVDAGVSVAVGHTQADFAQASAAFDRGARILTHAFNAMPGLHHRDPGPVGAAIADDRVILELILDGLHVHPALAHMLFAGAPGRVALVTDSMAAAGVADGDYQLGSLSVEVRSGRAVVAGTQTLAGSTLLTDRAFRAAVELVGPAAAVTALTSAPARALGIEDRFGSVAKGRVADFVLLDEDWSPSEIWAAGARIL